MFEEILKNKNLLKDRKNLRIVRVYKMINMRRLYSYLFPTSCLKYLKREIKKQDTVLELGCGNNSKLQFVDAKHKVGVELYESYIKESKKKRIHSKYIDKDITKLELEENSFDDIIAIDVIEHLKKEDGKKLLRNMEKWAKKKVIIYTPNGFLPQFSDGKNKYQEHLSGWNVNDFKSNGFKVIGIGGLKFLRGERAGIRFKPIICWRVISDLSQKITYYFPRLAFQLFAVKTLNKNFN